MILDISGYHGINREILFFNPGQVLIRFNALGNDEIDLQFRKVYKSNLDAYNSLKKYVTESSKPTKEELGPIDENWKDFEKKVNKSIIQLFRDSLNKTIYLPDNGTGYELCKTKPEHLKNAIDGFDTGEQIRYVTYNLK